VALKSAKKITNFKEFLGLLPRHAELTEWTRLGRLLKVGMWKSRASPLIVLVLIQQCLPFHSGGPVLSSSPPRKRISLPFQRASTSRDDLEVLIDQFLNDPCGGAPPTSVCSGQQTPDEVVTLVLNGLNELHEPTPYHGAALAMRFSSPLEKAEISRPDASSNVWRRLLRQAMGPRMLAQLIASSTLRPLLSWALADVPVRRGVPSDEGQLDLDVSVYSPEGIKSCFVFRLREPISRDSPWTIHSIVALPSGAGGDTVALAAAGGEERTTAEALSEGTQPISLADGLRQYTRETEEEDKEEEVQMPSNAEEYGKLTRVRLKELLRSRGGLVAGRKAELIERLLELDAQDIPEAGDSDSASTSDDDKNNDDDNGRVVDTTRNPGR
jgi:hypothetical protein